MSKKVLRLVRDELESVCARDMFVADGVKRCLALCNSVLEKNHPLPPHQVHSDTSTEAAVAIAPKFGKMTMSVLNFLAGQQGMTDEEAQRAMGLEGNSYRPCRVTLADRGYVADTGGRRMTAHRKRAVVWSITQKGRDYLADKAAGGK